MGKKLYQVTCEKFPKSITGNTQGVTYIVGENPRKAHEKLIAILEKRGLMLKNMDAYRFELIAEEWSPDTAEEIKIGCRTALYM